MKRALSYLLATSLIVSTVAVGGFSVSAETTVGEDRVVLVDDFESGECALYESGMDLLPVELVQSSEAKNSGDKSIMITHSGNLGGDPISELKLDIPEENKDFTDAKYIQFWVSNPSEQPIGLSWIRLNAELACQKSYIQQNEEWVEGRYFARPDGDGSFTEEDNTEWKKVWASNPVHVVPAGYTGLIRLELSGNGKNANVPSMNFGIIAQADGEQKLFIDDASIVFAGVSRHNLPTGLTGVTPTTVENNNGKITGVNSNMEYRKDGQTEYTAISGSEVTGLAPGKYFVRMKATNEALQSGDVAVEINAYVPPQAKDYLRLVNNFDSAAKAAEASAKEYPYLAGEEYTLSNIPGKNSKGVKMAVKADTNNPLQKTLITSSLGDLSKATYVQMYVNWTGNYELETHASADAYMGTPQWYYTKKAEDPNWENTDDGKFWKDWILVKGNTGSVVGDRCGKMMIFENGKWVEAKRAAGSTGFEGYIIPKGYKGYVRFELAESTRKANRNGGFMFQIKNAAEDLAGDFYFDDLMVGMTGIDAPAGFDIAFDEYIGGGSNNGGSPSTNASTTGVAVAALLALSSGAIIFTRRRLFVK